MNIYPAADISWLMQLRADLLTCPLACPLACPPAWCACRRMGGSPEDWPALQQVAAHLFTVQGRHEDALKLQLQARADLHVCIDAPPSA